MVGVVAGKDFPAEPSEEEFRIGLRSGIMLCNVLNKVQPGAVPKVRFTMFFDFICYILNKLHIKKYCQCSYEGCLPLSPKVPFWVSALSLDGV